LGTAAVALIAVLGAVPAGAEEPSYFSDGTLVQREGSERVAMIVDGNRVDFEDMPAVAEAGCDDGDEATVLSAATFDSIPAEPDPLYAAIDDEVDVGRIEPAPQYRSDCHPVYRADRRAPQAIFDEGFAARDVQDGQYDVRSYVLQNQPSPFVSTTYRDDLYKDWKSPYYYFVDAPGGVDVNATIGDDHKFADQEEVAFPGGILPRFIEKGCPVDRETLELIIAQCVDNPDYRPWRNG
ncbi:MAG: scabin-related ADP-ribosyltransferase, partial [Stackebrandtia sp.]